LTLALNAKSPAINRWVCAMGEASFSAYILHFFVLAELVRLLPALFEPAATGYTAIFRCLALWVAAVPITFVLSTATYRMIELPMIRVGRGLLERRAARRATAALAQPSAP
jgi:peptidoglycan/LPS O-acetylase OafA/YrhL